MNYAPYKEKFYIESNYIFEETDILNDGGVIDYNTPGEGIGRLKSNKRRF